MGLTINNNIPALQAQRNAKQANGLLARSLQQLSSGRRINRAGDDASGLAIAERFSTVIRQAQTEINSLQSGLSLVQTADGGLAAQQDATQRLRELAVQAANGTLSTEQRNAINTEAQQLLEQIGETATKTQFNGKELLSATQTIPLGAGGMPQVSLKESTLDSLGLNGLDLSTAQGASGAIQTIDTALQRISDNRANLGAQQNRFERALEVRGITVQTASEAESRIRDLDLALGAIQRTRGQIRLQAGLAALIQSNTSPQNALRLLGA